MTERTIPILPCRDIDEMVVFYEAIGFTVTYKQARPNPYLCVQRGGLDLHFFGLEAFEPESSMGSAIVLVDDTGSLYDAFAAGLRSAFGKVPVTGIPRMTRPRRKQGMAGGFTIVDPGGNWLRISSLAPEADDAGSGGLDRILLNATRQGDSHGDVPRAISILQTGLSRHGDAPDVDRVPVLAYLAELFVREGDLPAAPEFVKVNEASGSLGG